MTLRLAFMGSPDFAVPTLEAIISAGDDVVWCRIPSRRARRAEARSCGRRPFTRPPQSTASRYAPCSTSRRRTTAMHLRRCSSMSRWWLPTGCCCRSAILDAPRSTLQPARFDPAAMARRSADPSRGHGRRHTHRRAGDEDGDRARHGSGHADGDNADQRRRHDGRCARPAFGSRRRSHGRGARSA